MSIYGDPILSSQLGALRLELSVDPRYNPNFASAGFVVLCVALGHRAPIGIYSYYSYGGRVWGERRKFWFLYLEIWAYG